MTKVQEMVECQYSKSKAQSLVELAWLRLWDFQLYTDSEMH